MGNSQPGIWFDKVEIIMFIRLISDGNKKCGFISFYLFILSVNLMAELARGAKNHVEWSLWINVDHQIIQRENNWEKILYPPTVISWSDEIKRDSILVSLTASLTDVAEDRLKTQSFFHFQLWPARGKTDHNANMKVWDCCKFCTVKLVITTNVDQKFIANNSAWYLEVLTLTIKPRPVSRGFYAENNFGNMKHGIYQIFYVSLNV